MKKLKETFAFIQQLDKNMSNLRTWLARIESELSKPVVYDVCDNQEIQKRLAEQQVSDSDGVLGGEVPPWEAKTGLPLSAVSSCLLTHLFSGEEADHPPYVCGIHL